MRRNPCSLNIITWSRHSRRIEPISRSVFDCHTWTALSESLDNFCGLRARPAMHFSPKRSVRSTCNAFHLPRLAIRNKDARLVGL
jgi:hypothetical protein